MFDLGFWELVLIGIVGLLVVGPDRLPGFARELGRWVRKIRHLSSDARRELQRELQWDEKDDPRRDVARAKNELGQKLNDLDQLMQQAPDRQPGWQSEYTADGRKKPADDSAKDAATDTGEQPADDTSRDDGTRQP
ncbi:sec-independent protein translocase protein TatB [Methylohalomonas lacus]|uniref:Sec-independent protein translocase protein TatB n=1 Tax=Methylohalomonas lacus TaxID=398773 RepID=A0AAE3L107_9GAMM|nr:Sec-independent protein translocase protein TatB [Methylohalomonas lacus]MCS3903339.1 sec-independent protein translocase protein TatB [Methylohalomonas lacus]